MQDSLSIRRPLTGLACWLEGKHVRADIVKTKNQPDQHFLPTFKNRENSDRRVWRKKSISKETTISRGS